jgi:quinol monooxygenase YgiN
MIFITAKFKSKSEYADRWPELVADFTEATRAEDGCMWFEWSRSLSDPQDDWSLLGEMAVEGTS